MSTLTDAQLQTRNGEFTGSEIYKLMGAKGFGKTGETYIMEKVAEHLTGERATPEFSSAATAWGERYEPEAKAYFTAATGLQILPTDTLSNDLLCGTPDGLLAIGGIEIKCPYNAGNHLQNLLLADAAALRDLRPEYYWQIYSYMWLTGRSVWKFVSYHPSFPDEKRMLILSVAIVQADMDLLQQRVQQAKVMFTEILSRL